MPPREPAESVVLRTSSVLLGSASANTPVVRRSDLDALLQSLPRLRGASPH